MPLTRKRPAFLDSKTNNRAGTLIRDFKKGSRTLNNRSIAPDMRELIVCKEFIAKINAKGTERTTEDREKVKRVESQMRRIFVDIAAKRAKLAGKDVISAEPESK